MPKIVGIHFKKTCKIYYFDPLDVELAVGDHVIVETARGMEFGTVSIATREVPEKQIRNPLKPIIRKATAEDEAWWCRMGSGKKKRLISVSGGSSAMDWI